MTASTQLPISRGRKAAQTLGRKIEPQPTTGPGFGRFFERGQWVSRVLVIRLVIRIIEAAPPSREGGRGRRGIGAFPFVRC